MDNRDEEFMRAALHAARGAEKSGDIPVGAVVVKDGTVIASACNRREQDKDACAHAEILAIRSACRALTSWRLSGCTLYVTLEPCPMCAGAAVNARLDRVVYGAADEKAGSAGSLINLFAVSYNHRPALTGGVLEAECTAMLQDFFDSLR